MSNKIDELRKLSEKIDGLYACGKDSEGEVLLRRALEESKDVVAYHLFFQGEVEGYLNKNYEAQQKIFEQAISLEMNDFFLLRNLGISLSNQGKATEAMECFAKALAENPKDYISMQQMGVSLSKQGKATEAMEWYAKALAENPKDYASMRNMGVSLSNQGKATEAMEWYAKALVECPKDYHSMHGMGVSLSKQGKETEAMEWYAKSLAENPKGYDSMRDIGVSLSKQGKEMEAQEWFAKALAESPKDYASMRERGVSLSKQSKETEAMEWYAKALAESPKDYASMRQMGVSLSNQGKETKAMEWYAKALVENPKDYDSMRQMGVSLSKQSKETEAMEWYAKSLAECSKDYASMYGMGVSLSNQGKEMEAMEWYAKSLVENPKDYHSMRGMGVSLSKQGKETEAMEWYAKSLAENPKDYASMRNIGVSLSKQGKEMEAQEWFAKALAGNPNDYHSMRERGVSLSKQGKEMEAQEWYAKALVGNPEDYHSMQGMGVSLSKQDNDAEAIIWFDKALKLKEDDVNTLRNYSICKSKMGNKHDSLELIKKALKIDPENKDYQSVLQYISVKYKLNFELIMREISPASRVSISDVDKLRWLVQETREKFGPKIREYKRKMDESEKRLSEFLGLESNVQQDRSLLLTLRKWNSYTPTIPSTTEERYVGGGYVLYHGGKAIVIDPGHNFIENFSHAGGMIYDIDAIIMTHAHSDHTNDFESLLTLIYEYNDRHGFKADNEKFKKIDVYLNVGAMKKFSGLLDLRSSEYIRNIVVMSPYSNYTLSNGVIICPLPANHDELITKKYAVGLHVSIPLGSGKIRSILFTSDTGLFPKTKKKMEGGSEKTVANVDEKEIHELYNEYSNDIDVLVPHLGSIKPQEIEAEIKASLEGVFYPNHLGILGTIRLVTAIAPRLVFVSEFGEELCEFRSELMELMQEVVDKYCEGDGPVPRILPADTPLIYDIKSDEMYCVLSGSFRPAEKMAFKEYKGTFYYYNEDRKSELGRIDSRSKVFCACLQGRDKLYFAAT